MLLIWLFPARTLYKKTYRRSSPSDWLIVGRELWHGAHHSSLLPVSVVILVYRWSDKARYHCEIRESIASPLRCWCAQASDQEIVHYPSHSDMGIRVEWARRVDKAALCFDSLHTRFNMWKLLLGFAIFREFSHFCCFTIFIVNLFLACSG